MHLVRTLLNRLMATTYPRYRALYQLSIVPARMHSECLTKFVAEVLLLNIYQRTSQLTRTSSRTSGSGALQRQLRRSLQTKKDHDDYNGTSAETASSKQPHLTDKTFRRHVLSAMSAFQPHLDGLAERQRSNLTSGQRLLLLKQLLHHTRKSILAPLESEVYKLMQASSIRRRTRKHL